MASTQYDTPNLAAVLQTLAAYAPPPQASLEEGEYDPSESYPSAISFSAPQQLPLTPNHPPSQPTIRQSHSALLPSPASSILITTWPSALRHTMALLSNSPSMNQRIKRLINTAHEHERQWWQGREALIAKLGSREEGRKKLEGVLASIGGLTTPLTHDSATLTPIQEIALYDRKVHRACVEMVRATSAELAKMGIPFFGLREELIVRRGVERKDDVGKDTRGIGGEGKIGDAELKGLQKKMLGFLEELCQE